MWTGTIQNWVIIQAVLQRPVVGATIAGFIGRADVSALNHCYRPIKVPCSLTEGEAVP
jgi:hypothetical protein